MIIIVECTKNDKSIAMIAENQKQAREYMESLSKRGWKCRAENLFERRGVKVPSGDL